MHKAPGLGGGTGPPDQAHTALGLGSGHGTPCAGCAQPFRSIRHQPQSRLWGTEPAVGHGAGTGPGRSRVRGRPLPGKRWWHGVSQHPSAHRLVCPSGHMKLVQLSLALPWHRCDEANPVYCSAPAERSCRPRRARWRWARCSARGSPAAPALGSLGRAIASVLKPRCAGVAGPWAAGSAGTKRSPATVPSCHQARPGTQRRCCWEPPAP